MSIIRCTDCSIFLDTDESPEVFREGHSDEPLCENCYEDRERRDKLKYETRPLGDGSS